jgi:hypothetical protein
LHSFNTAVGILWTQAHRTNHHLLSKAFGHICELALLMLMLMLVLMLLFATGSLAHP